MKDPEAIRLKERSEKFLNELSCLVERHGICFFTLAKTPTLMFASRDSIRNYNEFLQSNYDVVQEGDAEDYLQGLGV